MEVGAGVIEDDGPVGRGGFVRPLVTEEVHHDGGRVLSRIAKGEAADGSHLLLELVGDAGVDGVVAAVVGAGGNLVDEDAAIAGDKHFHSHGADVVEADGDGFPEFERLINEVGLDAGGGDGDVEDVVGVFVFHDAMGGGAARDRPGANDGDLAHKRDPLLDHGVVPLELLPGGGEIGVGVDLVLPLAVVAECGGLDDTRAPEFRDGGLEFGQGLDDAEVGAGDALLAEEEFFPLAVLGGVDGAMARAQDAALFDEAQAGVGNVLELGSDDVHLIEEAGQRGFVLVRGVEFEVGDLSGGAALGFVGKSGDAIAVASGFECEHAAELAAAENAEGASGKNDFGGRHGAGSGVEFALAGEDFLLLCLAESGEFFGEGRVRVGQNGDREEAGIGGSGVADGKRRHRDAAGHLDDRKEAVLAAEGLGLDGDPEDGNGGHGGGHAGQVGRAACTSDDARETAILRGGGVFVKQLWRAVRADNALLIGDAEVVEDRGGVRHGGPVGAGAHDDPDFRGGRGWCGFTHRQERKVRGREEGASESRPGTPVRLWEGGGRSWACGSDKSVRLTLGQRKPWTGQRSRLQEGHDLC